MRSTTLLISLILLAGCRTTQKIKLPLCVPGQSAEFTVFHKENSDGSRNSAMHRAYICEQNGKWKEAKSYNEGIEITPEPLP